MSEDETVVLDLNLAEVAKMVAAFRTDQPRLLVAEIAPPSLWGVVDTHVILLIAPAVAPPLVATPLIAPPLALLATPLVPRHWHCLHRHWWKTGESCPH